MRKRSWKKKKNFNSPLQKDKDEGIDAIKN